MLKYKVYLATKEPSDIKGFWIDAEGKIYRDNIHITEYATAAALRKVIRDIFNTTEEKAILYAVNSEAAVINRDRKNSIKFNSSISYTCKGLKADKVKELLNIYGGLTIYRLPKNEYEIVAFYNDN